ncbi:39S ribosomal protein L15, mitochondrial-like [Anneissia japonica]|uniref:39S ribosomal protein L15, mitochondrial-like n=1 Tax=Anneissia japonica TaxID=1529436 RepID=UPI001425A4A0|nr:39S ribosomal protein L15, mitochondrial-like [Anneissia japonica]
MATYGNGVKRGLEIVRNMPRIRIDSIKDNPGARKKKLRRGRGQTRGNRCGRGKKGQRQRGIPPRIGFEGGQSPFYLSIPKEPYYAGQHLRRQYLPISLNKLQYLVDMGRINPDEPVDLTSLVNARAVSIDIFKKHYGVQLVSEGKDKFQAQLNIEVQWATEDVIAAIERNAGIITLSFYDLQSVNALAYPIIFFQRGVPIMRRSLPPKDLVDFYTNPDKRGYLADPDKVRKARFDLAQKFGYQLPDLSQDTRYAMLSMRKDPRQIFYGLEPGWVVNLKDKTVLKPKDEQLLEYYKS